MSVSGLLTQNNYNINCNSLGYPNTLFSGPISALTDITALSSQVLGVNLAGLPDGWYSTEAHLVGERIDKTKGDAWVSRGLFHIVAGVVTAFPPNPTYAGAQPAVCGDCKRVSDGDFTYAIATGNATAGAQFVREPNWSDNPVTPGTGTHAIILFGDNVGNVCSIKGQYTISRVADL